jgi:hypothetical protein
MSGLVAWCQGRSSTWPNWAKLATRRTNLPFVNKTTPRVPYQPPNPRRFAVHGFSLV